MRIPCPLLVVLFGAIEPTGAEVGHSTLVQTDAVTSQLLEWLHENGAYINEKLVVRHVVSDDPSSPRGVFATQSMEEGETVCRIPWNLIVKPRDWQWKDKSTKISDCGTIEEIKEMMSNQMTPYGEYLLAQPKGYTPGFWSEAASGLLNDMLDTDKDVHETEYDDLPPHDIEDVLGDIVGECHGDIDDELYRHAALMVKARGDYALLVPFYDMMNHHNGKFNVKHRYNPYDFESSELVERFGYDIITTKALNAGEELINSYNRCSACTDFYDWFGTPEMFLHYGFVEPLPQRWLFDFARIKFDLDWKDSDEGTNEVVVNFLVPPSEKGIKLLQQELTRLESFALVRETMNYEDEGISAGEWKSLWLYYDALHDALSYAVKSNASVTDDVWTWSDDWWVKDGTLVSADTNEHTVYPIKRSCDSNASQSQLCSDPSLQDHAVLSSQAPEEEMRRFTDASHSRG